MEWSFEKSLVVKKVDWRNGFRGKRHRDSESVHRLALRPRPSCSLGIKTAHSRTSFIHSQIKFIITIFKSRNVSPPEPFELADRNPCPSRYPNRAGCWSNICRLSFWYVSHSRMDKLPLLMGMPRLHRQFQHRRSTVPGTSSTKCKGPNMARHVQDWSINSSLLGYSFIVVIWLFSIDR